MCYLGVALLENEGLKAAIHEVFDLPNAGEKGDKRRMPAKGARWLACRIAQANTKQAMTCSKRI